uniref:Uncharacterized protein n=1 Tax=Picea sitchensis TaxID=3332 RepID=D5AAS2_PICSI|nr:unknown [Picea sitchensis]
MQVFILHSIKLSFHHAHIFFISMSSHFRKKQDCWSMIRAHGKLGSSQPLRCWPSIQMLASCRHRSTVPGRCSDHGSLQDSGEMIHKDRGFPRLFFSF